MADSSWGKSWIWSDDWSALGFSGGLDGKESACNAEDLGSIPGIGKVPGEGNGYPLQDSCLKNSMNRGALHGASMRWTRLSNEHFPFHWSDLVATVEM